MRAVNLLPPDLRGASKTTAELSVASEASGGAGPFVVLGVLAACVAGAAGYVLAGNTVNQRHAELASATAQQQALAGRVAALKPYADFDAKAQSQTQTVRDLATTRFDWQQVLSDVARAVPADVTLRSLIGDISADSGGSSDQLRGAISAPAITLEGCAPDQSRVARLMAQLRDVDGVTRVSLSRSDNTLTTGSSGAATDARNAAPCGAGSHPSFQMVAFFEKAAAAVSAPAAGSTGATVTPTPTPTATPAGSSATSTTGATP